MFLRGFLTQNEMEREMGANCMKSLLQLSRSLASRWCPVLLVMLVGSSSGSCATLQSPNCVLLEDTLLRIDERVVEQERQQKEQDDANTGIIIDLPEIVTNDVLCKETVTKHFPDFEFISNGACWIRGEARVVECETICENLSRQIVDVEDITDEESGVCAALR